MNSPPIKVNRLAELLKKHQKILGEAQVSNIQTQANTQANSDSPTQTQNLVGEATDRYGNSITYNSQQQSAISMAVAGQSCVVIGAAGTGKTTVMKGVATSLVTKPGFPILKDTDHKYLQDNLPGIVFCAYTRRATANLRKNLPTDLQSNCITIHKLLEYEPVYNSVIDPESGEEKTVMNFEPTRTANRPLPSSIHTIIVEESSMVSVELYRELEAALPHAPQFIFLGDIQQLPPVFGAAILGYKMLEFPLVELTEVYRQALESPIIRLAHRILSGIPIPATEFQDWFVQDQLKIVPWTKKLRPDLGCMTISKFLTNAYNSSLYSPTTDIILCPYDKSEFGCIEINKSVANHIARTHGVDTYEIIAGFQSYYYSVGDKILVDKEDAVITRIELNAAYMGKPFLAHSPTLDYWGIEHGSTPHYQGTGSIDDVDSLLDTMSNPDSDERVRQASHIIYYSRYMEDGTTSIIESKIETASAFNSISLGYAITVHKSQGSEWDKVFLIFHQSHSKMIQRELLYTAVTRAKKELYIICEPESLVNGIKSQRIVGNTLKEKIEFFKGKKEQLT